jgi:hypothetical protein
VDQNVRKPGKRDAESRPSENLATGEPCAWKSRKHGSGSGGWNRTRIRLAVTAEANGRINELRRKPSTSPAAYSTVVQSRSEYTRSRRDTDSARRHHVPETRRSPQANPHDELPGDTPRA